METFKPPNYNSLSPYLIVDNAEKLIDLLILLFEAKELRRYDHDNGKVAHAELMIDDSVIMIANSTDQYPSSSTILHLYVPDAIRTYELAINNGCEPLEKPTIKTGDPDMRGAFLDFAGNYWAISTQEN